MKMLLSLIVLFLLNSANLYSQEKLPARPTDLPEAKPLLRSEWKKGYQDKSRTRWDDRLEGRVERLEDAVDYLLYANEQVRSDAIYQCSMSICRKMGGDCLFCRSESDFKTTYSELSKDKIELYNALKTGSCFKAQTFSCRPV